MEAPCVQVYGLISSSWMIRQDSSVQVGLLDWSVAVLFSPMASRTLFLLPHPPFKHTDCLPAMLPLTIDASEMSSNRPLCRCLAGRYFLFHQHLHGADSHLPNKGMLESLLLSPHSSPVPQSRTDLASPMLSALMVPFGS